VTFIGDKKGFCNCGYDNVSGRYFGRAKQRWMNMRFYIDIDSDLSEQEIRKGIEDTLHTWTKYKAINNWLIQNVQKHDKRRKEWDVSTNESYPMKIKILWYVMNVERDG
jgi:hypothetical protein